MGSLPRILLWTFVARPCVGVTLGLRGLTPEDSSLPRGAVALDASLRRKGQQSAPFGHTLWGRAANPPKFVDRTISPVLVDRRPSHGSFLGCFPCKNGMMWWMNFACSVDPACGSKDAPEATRLFELPAEDARAVMDDVSIPRFVITRNPLIRALAGFLTWVENGNEFHYVPPTFEGFVKKLDESRVAFPTSETYTWSKNPHWRSQLEYCGINHGEQFVAHKAEERRDWGPRLFKELGRGYADVAARLNFTRADQPNGPSNVCPGYHCHAKAVMLMYYTPGLYDRLNRFYAEDIKTFGYETEVQELRDELFGLGGSVNASGKVDSMLLRRVASSAQLQGMNSLQLAKLLDSEDGVDE